MPRCQPGRYTAREPRGVGASCAAIRHRLAGLRARAPRRARRLLSPRAEPRPNAVASQRWQVACAALATLRLYTLQCNPYVLPTDGGPAAPLASNLPPSWPDVHAGSNKRPTRSGGKPGGSMLQRSRTVACRRNRHATSRFRIPRIANGQRARVRVGRPRPHGCTEEPSMERTQNGPRRARPSVHCGRTNAQPDRRAASSHPSPLLLLRIS